MAVADPGQRRFAARLASREEIDQGCRLVLDPQRLVQLQEHRCRYRPAEPAIGLDPPGLGQQRGLPIDDCRYVVRREAPFGLGPEERVERACTIRPWQVAAGFGEEPCCVGRPIPILGHLAPQVAYRLQLMLDHDGPAAEGSRLPSVSKLQLLRYCIYQNATIRQ